MNNVIDIFRNDCFSFMGLRQMVDNLPHIPTTLGDWGIFNPQPLEGTETVTVWEQDGIVQIIPFSQRGGPSTRRPRESGRMWTLKCRRLAEEDTIRASELLGNAGTLLPEPIVQRRAMDMLRKRTDNIRTDFYATMERLRLGAIKGKLLDADGSVECDYFDIFGVAEPAALTINFAAIPAGELITWLTSNVTAPMQTYLNNRWIEGQSYAGCVIGDYGWNKLVNRPEVQEMYKLMMQGGAIQQGLSGLMEPKYWSEITLAGIRFKNYRGSTDGAISIAQNEAQFFPMKAKDVFDVYWAPGETTEQVTQPARSLYVMVQPDVRDQIADHADIHVRSYPLPVCHRPGALRSAIIS